jgi:hypothetical protein
VLAIDDARGWMLLRDFGGVPLDKVPDVARWEEAMRAFAHLQIDCAGRLSALEGLGCPVRSLDDMGEQMDVLFADTASMFPNEPRGLTDEEIERLRGLAPRLKQMCIELVGYGVPYSLEHGDLWSSNIILSENDYIFFDWSDSSLVHPFFSLLLLLEDALQAFPTDPSAPNRLRDAYLEQWQPYAPMDRLLTAFELSQPLAALHYALTYHRIVLPGMEAPWEMENMLPMYLKLVLRLMR